MPAEIDFHDLSERIHRFGKDVELHWDNLIIKYLRTEVIDPLVDAQNELAAQLKELTGVIKSLRDRLDASGALTQDPEEFISAVQAGKLLRLHPRTIIDLAKRKKLNGHRTPGGQWRFRRDDLTHAIKKT